MVEDKYNNVSLEKEINRVRLLFFIESLPFSNNYFQIELSKEQFDCVSKNISSCLPKDIYNHTIFNVSKTIYPLPDLKEVYNK